MSELIDRQAAIDALDILDYMPGKWCLKGLCEDAIKAVLPAQPESPTDKEQRIFLAAKDTLVSICHEITRKVKGALWTI